MPSQPPSSNTTQPPSSNTTQRPSSTTTKPPSSNTFANTTKTKGPFKAELEAMYAVRNNKIYVIQYGASVELFNNPQFLNARTKMFNPFTSPPPKPAYCNQPIFTNTTACK